MPKDYVINHFTKNTKDITKCYNALMDATTPNDVYANAFCYLCYRSLEHNFSSEFLLDRVEEVMNKINNIEDIQTKHRWRSSVLIAIAYVLIKFKYEDVSIDNILEQGSDKSLAEYWPRIIPNVMMSNMLRIARAIAINDYSTANNWIRNAILCYKTAIQSLDISIHYSHDVIFELKDAAALMGGCILLGSLSNFEIQYLNSLNLIDNLHHTLFMNGAKKYYFVLCKILPQLMDEKALRFIGRDPVEFTELCKDLLK